MEEALPEQLEPENISVDIMDAPLYISIEGLFDCPSPSEIENDCPVEQKRAKRTCTGRKLKGSYYDDPDWEYDFDIKSEDETEGTATASKNKTVDESTMNEDLVALSKKQLNRLAAMDIYPIPSGGIGTVNASLFNPITVKWLMENFETVEGSSLPRFLVYNHYLLHCKSLNINPINAASFGKVIRSVFLGLQTRRLGTRGNSKYHYCGMRIKPDSTLLNISVSDCEIRRSRGRIGRGLKYTSVSYNFDPEKLSSTSWTSNRFTAWWTTYIQDLSEDIKSLHLQNLQNAMRPLEETLKTNHLYISVYNTFKDEEKMNILLSALEEINFVQLDSEISWVNNDNKILCGQKLRDILSQPNWMQDLTSWIEELIEEKVSSSLPIMSVVKIKLQDFLVGLSYYMAHLRRELICISNDSFGTFNSVENFILEYLKHFAHLRIEMQNVITSVCNETPVSVVSVDETAYPSDLSSSNQDLSENHVGESGDCTNSQAVTQIVCDMDLPNNNQDVTQNYSHIIKIEVNYSDEPSSLKTEQSTF